MVKKKITYEEMLNDALDVQKPYKLPDKWVWVKLDSIAVWASGGTPSRKNESYYNGTIPWIKTGELNNNTLIDSEEKITEEAIKNSSAKLFEVGSVLIAMYGATIGKVALLGIPAATNQACASASVYNGVYNQYLFNYLASQKEVFISKGKGGAQPNISQTVIKKHPFPLPSLAEQKRIVSKIDNTFEKLEKAKELLLECLEEFEDRRSAILHKAFTGELTQRWREENANQIDECKSRFKYIREIREGCSDCDKDVINYFDNVDIDSVRNSMGWLLLKTKAMCNKITCGKTPTGHISDEGEIPFLKVYNIVNNSVNFDYKPQYIDNNIHSTKLKSSRLRPNDIIMNIVGPPLRKVAIIPNTFEEWNMNQAIVRFRCLEILEHKYLYYALLYPKTLDNVINRTRGVVGQANISVTQSRNLEIPVPCMAEQKEIVRILDLILEKEASSKELINAIEDIEQMKKAILAKAFRGELGTANEDDEDAMRLVERICRERANG